MIDVRSKSRLIRWNSTWPPHWRRQIAEFVERDQINAAESLGEPAGYAGASLGLQTVDEVDDVKKRAERFRLRMDWR